MAEQWFCKPPVPGSSPGVGSGLARPILPDVSDLRGPIQYDNWATETLADFCVTLSPGQVALTTPGTYGTVASTIVHLVAAKERYVASFSGQPAPADAVREGQTTDLAHVAARARVLSTWLDRYGAGDIELERIIERRAANGELQRVRLLVLLIQLLHHGNEHRAQLGSIFGAHDIEAPHYSAFRWAEVTGRGYVRATPSSTRP